MSTEQSQATNQEQNNIGVGTNTNDKQNESNAAQLETNNEQLYVEFVDDGRNNIKAHIYPLDQEALEHNHWPPLNKGPGGRICISDYSVLAGLRFVSTRSELVKLGLIN